MVFVSVYIHIKVTYITLLHQKYIKIYENCTCTKKGLRTFKNNKGFCFLNCVFNSNL